MEILGNDLEKAMKYFNIVATQTYKGEKFEVWEMDDGNFCRLCGTDEAEWEGLGWWRSGNCILEGDHLYRYLVNGSEMLGYLDKYFLADLNDEDDEEVLDETYFTDRKYNSFTDWLSEVMQLSTERNIAYFATSLAKENNLSLSEFMKKYQP